MFSTHLPFVLNPDLFSLGGWSFPVNFWEGVAISSVAVLMSYVNNSLFLTKIPQVRGALLGMLKELPNVQHLALYFPVEIFKALRGENKEVICDKKDAIHVSRQILDGYPNELISPSHKELLVPELAEVICGESDPQELLKFLKKRITELKKEEKKK